MHRCATLWVAGPGDPQRWQMHPAQLSHIGNALPIARVALDQEAVDHEAAVQLAVGASLTAADHADGVLAKGQRPALEEEAALHAVGLTEALLHHAQLVCPWLPAWLLAPFTQAGKGVVPG